MDIKEIYQIYSKHSVIATDTRKIATNSLFFALKGANFDANQFATEALEKGASYVVIDDEKYYKKENNYILVDDVLKTLQELASYHRDRLGIPVLALTGSNGKTTTKELVNAVLSKKFNTVATRGNLNNHIGVPLTLLSMNSDTEIGIVEMGANHFGEIALLCEIAKPNYGYITNFGKAHLEGFGSLDGVIKAKSELYTYLKNNNGIAFVNTSDAIQMDKTASQQRVVLGEKIKDITSDSFVKVNYLKMDIQSRLIGAYNFSNILAAIGIGDYFKVPLVTIKKGIEGYTPNDKRSQLIIKNSTEIILDAYNANPTSMKAAIDNFKQHTALNKITILGDMFELGESAEIEHQEITNLAENAAFNTLILIGENFFKVQAKKAIQFKNYALFEAAFNKASYANSIILIKGSRGMALERIVDLFD